MCGNLDEKVKESEPSNNNNQESDDIEVNVSHNKQTELSCNCSFNDVKMHKKEDLGEMMTKIMYKQKSGKTKIKIEIEFSE